MARTPPQEPLGLHDQLQHLPGLFVGLPEREGTDLGIEADDGRLGERVGAVRVPFRHATREVDHPGDQRLITITESSQGNPTVRRFEFDAGVGVSYRRNDETYIADFWQDIDQ